MPKFNMNSDLFHEMIDTVKGGVPSDVSAIQAEGFTPGVRITVANDGKEIFAQAHSSTMSVTSESYPLNSGEDGEFPVPAAWVLKTKGKLPNEAMSMEIKGDDVVLKSGRFRTVSEQTEAAIFEVSKDPQIAFSIVGGDLVESITIAMKSMGKNDYRFILNGVHLLHSENTMTIIGTDGFTASKCTKTLDATSPKTNKLAVTIPSHSVNYAVNLLRKHTDKEVSVTANEHFIQFLIQGGPSITSPLVGGKFPSPEQLFNHAETDPRRVLFSTNRIDLIGAVQRIAALSKEKGNPIILVNCDAGKSNLVISLPEDAHNGRRKARDEVKIAREPGYDEKIHSSYNGDYLANLLQSSKSENVQIAVANQGTRKATLLGLNSDDGIGLIIMPINI